MPSLPEPLRHALATGATVITPNRRLARRIAGLDDREQRNAGRLAWAAPRVLPWDAWLSALWQDAVAAGAASYELRLQSPVQAAHAWRRIVAAHAAPLVDPEGAAVLAADAWETVHAGGEGGAGWGSWGGDALVGEEWAAFARWARPHPRRARPRGGRAGPGRRGGPRRARRSPLRMLAAMAGCPRPEHCPRGLRGTLSPAAALACCAHERRCKRHAHANAPRRSGPRRARER